MRTPPRATASRFPWHGDQPRQGGRPSRRRLPLLSRRRLAAIERELRGRAEERRLEHISTLSVAVDGREKVRWRHVPAWTLRLPLAEGSEMVEVIGEGPRGSMLLGLLLLERGRAGTQEATFRLERATELLLGAARTGEPGNVSAPPGWLTVTLVRRPGRGRAARGLLPWLAEALARIGLGGPSRPEGPAAGAGRGARGLQSGTP